jgi:hypothetical protein
MMRGGQEVELSKRSSATNGSVPATTPDGTRPRVIIERGRGIFHVDFRALWDYRELLYFLVWRDVRVRYKQTIIGAAWAILQPLLTTLIFLVIFGKFAKFPSDGFPYSIFAYAAILPWYFFSQALTNASQSLVGESNLLKKVYFPRLLIPLAAVMRPAVDFGISFIVLLVMMAWYGVNPKWTMLAVPLFLVFAMITALSGRRAYDPLFDASLDVRFARCILDQSDSRAMATPLRFESDGRCDRRVSLGHFGNREPQSWDACG